ncbi:MAG: hypothetical protein AAF591_18940 [Verrucomicrobiota bacterium]
MLTDQYGNPLSKKPTKREKIARGVRLGRIGLVALVGSIALLAANIETIKNSLFPDQGQLDVALVVTAKQGEGEDDFEYGRYSYRATHSKGNISIRKSGEFYKNYHQDGRVLGGNCGYYEGGFHIILPVIDFMVANNTNDTIVISELVVDVAESSPDQRTPIYMVSEAVKFATITLLNQGWTSIESCKLEFDLITVPRIQYPQNKQIPWPKSDQRKFGHSMSIDGFSSSTNVDFSPVLRKELADFDYVKRAYGETPYNSKSPGWRPIEDLKNFVDAVKPFEFESLDDPANLNLAAIGRMTVKRKGLVDDNVEFAAWIPLTRPIGLGGGAGIIPSNKCDITFRESSKNYQIKFPLALWAEPQSPLRIPIVLGGSKSGFHRFTFSLLGNGKTLYRSPVVDAEIAIPQAASF